jgi:hypothetical protein
MRTIFQEIRETDCAHLLFFVPIFVDSSVTSGPRRRVRELEDENARQSQLLRRLRSGNGSNGMNGGNGNGNGNGNGSGSVHSVRAGTAIKATRRDSTSPSPSSSSSSASSRRPGTAMASLAHHTSQSSSTTTASSSSSSSTPPPPSKLNHNASSTTHARKQLWLEREVDRYFARQDAAGQWRREAAELGDVCVHRFFCLQLSDYSTWHR